MTDKEEVMKSTKRLMGWLTAIALTLLTLALAGCGGSSTATAPPAALTGVTATAGDTQVNVNWTPVASAATYNIYYATTASVTTASATKVTGITGPQAVINLTNGTAYHFVVTAVNAGGESALSNEVSATPVPPVPVQPAGLIATPADGQITVSWTATSGATSYNLYYATSAGVTTNNSTKITGATSGLVIPSLANGTTYHFVVTAVNLGGESVLSSEVSATPVPPAPLKPAGLVASGGDSQVTVSWTAASGATSYNVYYATSAGVTTTNSTKVAGATSGQVVPALTNGTVYFFVVTAVNAGGESGVSSEKTATPAAIPQAPGSPTGVTTTAGLVAGQVTVAWAAVTVATSYNVYYLQSASAPSTATVISTGTKLSSTASPLNVTGLTAGGSYYFSVTAVNAGGESGGQTNPKKPVAAIL
jgi:fibronectin type 3 domain-containing protein